MKLKDRIVFITGAGSGIGAAMARRFAQEKARKVIVTDNRLHLAQQVAESIDGIPLLLDVANPVQMSEAINEVELLVGPIDLFCSNAGILIDGFVDVTDPEWQLSWDINLMAHVHAAKLMIPRMQSRGAGYLLHTVSAAGMLTQVGAAPYSVTKHAAFGFAEWLSITYQDSGIKVSCLCPQGVRTEMLQRNEGTPLAQLLSETALTPDQVAQCVVEGLEREEFLILPHSEVRKYFSNRATDHERWLRGLRKIWKACRLLKD